MRGRGNRKSTPPTAFTQFHRYEAKFYEWQALSYAAKILATPVLANVRFPIPGLEYLQSPEIDGVAEINGQRFLIEVKSYALSQTDIDQIVSKYHKLKPDELILIAPSFPAGLIVPSGVQTITFVPDVTPLYRAYTGTSYLLSSPLQEKLQTGNHHFRFVSIARNKGETASFRNQIDKRIKTVTELMHDIRRRNYLSDLPIRVFWSVSQWLFPKELFFSTYRNHLLQRGVVFDIDGKIIHNETSPCELLPGQTICMLCLAEAKATALRLINFLDNNGFIRPTVVFSGRQGFHLYLQEHNLTEPDIHHLVKQIKTADIKIDPSVTLDPKAVVTFPGSIHGLSMLPAFPIDNLQVFELNHIPGIRLSNSLQ